MRKQGLSNTLSSLNSLTSALSVSSFAGQMIHPVSPCEEAVGAISRIWFKRDRCLFKDKQGLDIPICSTHQSSTGLRPGKEVVLAHSVGCGTNKTVLKNVFVICVVLACSSKTTKPRITMTAIAKTSRGCSAHQLET